MIHRPSRFLRPIAFCAFFAALAYAWRGYLAATWMHLDFAGLTRDLEPLYAVSRVTDVWASPAFDRFAVAILVTFVGLRAIVACVAVRRATWTCLSTAVVAVFAINVAVARIPNGYASLIEPFSRRNLEYYPDVARVENDPLAFVQAYPRLARSHRLGMHPGTHPPGGVLFLYFGGKAIDAAAPALDLFLGPAPPVDSPTPPPHGLFEFVFGGSEAEPEPVPTRGQSLDAACWLAIAFTALGVLPAFWLATLVGGAAAARRMLPLYAAASNLVLFGATSMDGVFLTFGLAALAAGVQAMRRWSIVWPIVAGAALWLATFMTFAVVSVPTLMGCYALAVAVRRPRRGGAMLARCLLVGAAFLAFQSLAEVTLKYDLRATVEAAMGRDESAMGTGYETFERYWKLALANGLAFAFGSGLATLAAFALSIFRFSPRRGHAVGVAALATVIAMSASTLFSLETERVWLCLTPTLLIAGTRVVRGKVMWVLVIAALAAQTIWTEVHFRTYW